MAKYCRFCGSQITDGVKFCPECGKNLAAEQQAENPLKEEVKSPVPERIFCAGCGAEILPGKKFCADCGAPIAQTVRREPYKVPTPQQQTPPQPPAQAARPEQTAQPIRTEPERQTPVVQNQTNTPIPAKTFCPKCGKEVTPGTKFCRACGAPVSQTPQTAPKTPTVQSAAQTVRTAAGQAARPVVQAVKPLAQNASGLGLLTSPGEIGLELPELNAAASAVKSGGVSGFVKFLISIAAGGLSIPLLSGLESPASFFVGAGISVLLIVVSSIIKKIGGGGK